MSSPLDRAPHILEQQYPALPLPPLNVFCSSGFLPQTFDVRWTSPTDLQANSQFNIVGVNIYRSFDSEFGPYFRLNTLPVGSSFYRDRTRIVQVLQENVSQFFTARSPTDPGGKFVFRTLNKPIVIFPSLGLANITNLNVQVTVNGVNAFVQSIQSVTGEVELRNFSSFDVASQKQTPPVLPLNSSDVVLASYRYLDNTVRTDLAQRVFYRITTVAQDDSTGNLIETPLTKATQASNLEVEKLDYIWREAIRRTKWILDQGGERVKVFIRKAVGVKCGCQSNLHKQASSDCLGCFGVGILGGYDGPYDITIAPDDAEKNIEQSNMGRRMSHVYETWTIPSPMLSQRDFIVKLNGDRYGIGPVRVPSVRGMYLNQFFSISHIDETDVRYKVPVLDTTSLVAFQTRYSVPGRGDATPMITDRVDSAFENQIRGSTVTFENISRKQ